MRQLRRKDAKEVGEGEDITAISILARSPNPMSVHLPEKLSNSSRNVTWEMGTV
jgi:hypothetical protein